MYKIQPTEIEARRLCQLTENYDVWFYYRIPAVNGNTEAIGRIKFGTRCNTVYDKPIARLIQQTSQDGVNFIY